jgi:hypothetical protein
MSDIDAVLEKIRFNSSILSNYHRKRYLVLRARLKYYRLPIIVGSALNSVASVSLQPFMGQTYISLINMFLSLICGIIASIELFYGLTKQMEVELVSQKDAYILAADIHKWLCLKLEHKSIDPQTFLNESYNRYIKLVDTSLVLKKKIDDKMVELPIIPQIIPPSVSTTELFVDTSSEDSP